MPVTDRPSTDEKTYWGAAVFLYSIAWLFVQLICIFTLLHANIKISPNDLPSHNEGIYVLFPKFYAARDAYQQCSGRGLSYLSVIYYSFANLSFIIFVIAFYVQAKLYLRFSIWEKLSKKELPPNVWLAVRNSVILFIYFFIPISNIKGSYSVITGLPCSLYSAMADALVLWWFLGVAFGLTARVLSRGGLDG